MRKGEEEEREEEEGLAATVLFRRNRNLYWHKGFG